MRSVPISCRTACRSPFPANRPANRSASPGSRYGSWPLRPSLHASASHPASPGLISSIGPPSRCAEPQPAVTIRVWPSGCVCHAVCAPGSKVTRAMATRAGSGGLFSGSVSAIATPFVPGDQHNEPVSPRHYASFSRCKACTCGRPESMPCCSGRRELLFEGSPLNLSDVNVARWYVA